MKFRILFRNGKLCDQESGDMDILVSELRERISYLHDLKADDIIGFLDAASRSWKKAFSREYGVFLNHVMDTLRKENLEIMLDTALRDRHALDGFVSLNKGDTLFHAQPRGLVVHWMAGNVPMLGLFSVFQALLTKNVSLVKASSRAWKDLVKLLESLMDVSTPRVKGSDIVKAIAVVTADRDDRETLTAMSNAADVRIAWGGQEAVDSILSLRKRFSTVDVIHGPKYSYALIGRETPRKGLGRLCQRLAVDVSVFDQNACSSPHTVFVEKGGEVKPLELARELAKQLELVNRMLLPKGETVPGKAMDILKVRTKYEMTGEVFSSVNTDWTVVLSDEKGLAEPCFSRVVFVRPIDDAGEIFSFNNRNKQTLGLEMPRERRLDIADRTTLLGMDRCPRIGEMSFFESPWDGEFVMDRMVRWVTCRV